MAKAYVLIVNKSGKDDYVIFNLKNISSITDAFDTFGTYDVLIKLKSSDEKVFRIPRIFNFKNTPTASFRIVLG